jgi:DNA-binding transcriptional MerR regulator
MEGQFMKAYSIKEVQEITKVPSGTIRQWEKDLDGVFNVPRDENRNRYYTDFEIDMIKKIKQMRDKNLSIAMIKDLMKMHSETFEGDSQLPFVQPSVPQMSQNEAISTLKEIQMTLKSFEELKKQVKTEIRNEILTEVTKQIAATSVLSQEQVKTITSSISNTSEEVLKLSKAFEEETKRAEKDRRTLEDEIKKAEKERQLIAERDRLLVENMRVLKEIREEQNKGLLQKIFGKKNRSS